MVFHLAFFGWVHGSLVRGVELTPLCHSCLCNYYKWYKIRNLLLFFYSILYLLDFYPDLCFDDHLEQTLKDFVSDPVMS